MDYFNNFYNYCFPTPPALTQEQKNTRLYHAVKHSNLEDIKQLLNDGAQANAIYEDYDENAIDIGLRKGNFQAVAYLIDHDPSIDKTSTLLKCARRGKVELVDLLINQHKIDVNITDNNNETALSSAIDLHSENHVNTVAFLLKKGANPNINPTSHQPILHRAINNASPKMIALLIQHGVDLKTLDAEGKTALDCGLDTIQHSGTFSQINRISQNIFCLLNTFSAEELNGLEENPLYKTTILHYKKAVLEIQKEIVKRLAPLFHDDKNITNQAIVEHANEDIKALVYQQLLMSMPICDWYLPRLEQDLNYLSVIKLPKKATEPKEPQEAPPSNEVIFSTTHSNKKRKTSDSDEEYLNEEKERKNKKPRKK